MFDANHMFLRISPPVLPNASLLQVKVNTSSKNNLRRSKAKAEESMLGKLHKATYMKQLHNNSGVAG